MAHCTSYNPINLARNMAEQPTRLPASHAPLQAALPIDVLRIVLAALLGEERQDAYVLVRPLASFMRVCKAWREAALTTPLSMNIDYLAGELPTAAVRWLQRMTFADLQVNPGEGQHRQALARPPPQSCRA